MGIIDEEYSSKIYRPQDDVNYWSPIARPARMIYEKGISDSSTVVPVCMFDRNDRLSPKKNNLIEIQIIKEDTIIITKNNNLLYTAVGAQEHTFTFCEKLY